MATPTANTKDAQSKMRIVAEYTTKVYMEAAKHYNVFKSAGVPVDTLIKALENADKEARKNLALLSR